MTSREQLTLFVAPPHAAMLDALRAVLDPVQAGIIAAHVTLCREDELAGITDAQIRARLADAAARAITLRFGAPERVGGHGILLPCVDGAEAFDALRAVVLGTPTPRPMGAHLTLAHPRNPRAAGNDLERARALNGGIECRFGAITRIRQEGDGVWARVAEFALGPA